MHRKARTAPLPPTEQAGAQARTDAPVPAGALPAEGNRNAVPEGEATVAEDTPAAMAVTDSPAASEGGTPLPEGDISLPEGGTLLPEGSKPACAGESPAQTDAGPKGKTATARSGSGKRGITVREMTLFAMFGSLMYCSKILMEWAPNVHFLALFIIALTVVYRWKAIIPLYVFIFLTGLMNGFGVWWIPYLYIWLPLFFLALALPRNMPKPVAVPVYMLAGGLHGILFGTLYAPAQALLFHLNFEKTIAWILAGLPWDAVHAAGNLAACTLAVPMIELLKRLERHKGRA